MGIGYRVHGLFRDVATVEYRIVLAVNILSTLELWVSPVADNPGALERSVLQNSLTIQGRYPTLATVVIEDGFERYFQRHNARCLTSVVCLL